MGCHRMGAGVVPFCVKNGVVYFLFHKTFSGRRAGALVDFGGNSDEDESYRQTAIREFIEETEGMYFAEDITDINRKSELILDQAELLVKLFNHTLDQHPKWISKRVEGRGVVSKCWKSFFIEFQYEDVSGMNAEWEKDKGRKFKKRRELIWIRAEELQAILKREPDRLWKRLRKLEKLDEIIDDIVLTKQN